MTRFQFFRITAAAALTWGAASAASAQTPAQKGEQLYEACAACHSIDKGGDSTVGPNLWGIYGAKAGAHPGFDYSAELKKSGLVWNDANLDKWLKSPADLVPGNLMGYPGMSDPAERAAMIAFLKSKGG